MAILNQQQIQAIPSQNQLMVGAKGPLALRLNLDFTAVAQFVLDLQNMQALNQLDLCQTLYIDNSKGGAALDVTVPASGQVITAKAGTQGYYNIICPNPIGLIFDCAGGARITIFLINVAIPGATWSAI